MVASPRERRFLLFAGLGLLAWSLGGCFPFGLLGPPLWGKEGTREITDETRVSQIWEGTTTKADLLGLFGKPESVWVVPTNEELMIARHTLARTRL